MKIRLPHMLLAIGALGLVLAAISPAVRGILRLPASIHTSQQRVIRDLDHHGIRDAAIKVLSNRSDRNIELDELPDIIAKTEPNHVQVLNGVLYIEYGGGHSHFGLLIDENGNGRIRETKLIDDVYFYSTE